MKFEIILESLSSARALWKQLYGSDAKSSRKFAYLAQNDPSGDKYKYLELMVKNVLEAPQD